MIHHIQSTLSFLEDITSVKYLKMDVKAGTDNLLESYFLFVKTRGFKFLKPNFLCDVSTYDILVLFLK